MLLLDNNSLKSVTVIADTIWSAILKTSSLPAVRVILALPTGLNILMVNNITIADIKLVIMNTINTYFNIFPNLLKLTILAILLEIVKKLKVQQLYITYL